MVVIRAIVSFFQVFHTLITALDFSDESHVVLHRQIVVKIVNRLSSELEASGESIVQCTPKHEVRCFCLCSVNADT